MKVSIIIPTRNNAKTILKTIESIYSSNNINKKDFEIIVIDDFSLDGSYDLIKNKFPTVNIIRLKKQRGAAKARNNGVEEAKGDILIFIDGDAWFNKSTINTLIENVDKEIDILFPKVSLRLH